MKGTTDMLEIKSDQMIFSFPNAHGARLTVSLMRTLRIPDDGKKYPLPPGLGTFPVRHVDDYRSRLPEKWVKHGGVLIPMYQSEAMWLNFSSSTPAGYANPWPFAIKIATGKRSAVTGKAWSKHLKEGDYVVAPQQHWIDGYVVADGVIRQFVAAPLGQGFTAEEQITGKAEFGGLQIEVIPMSQAAYERRFNRVPERRDRWLGDRRSVVRARGCSTLKSAGPSLSAQSWPKGPAKSLESLGHDFTNMDSLIGECAEEGVLCLSDVDSRGLTLGNTVSELGLAPGGQMAQQVLKDPYGMKDWDTGSKSRCFVHLLNSMTWRAVTGSHPPTVPLTAADYSRHGFPWFDLYQEGRTASGTSTTHGLKGIAELEKEKGVKILPENESAKPKHVVKLGSRHGEVRDGSWK